MNQITFTVTKKHLSEGRMGCSNECAIAQALTDLGYKDVQVTGSISLRDKDNSFHSYYITEEICHFINAYDNGKFFGKGLFEDRVFTIIKNKEATKFLNKCEIS